MSRLTCTIDFFYAMKKPEHPFLFSLLLFCNHIQVPGLGQLKYFDPYPNGPIFLGVAKLYRFEQHCQASSQELKRDRKLFLLGEARPFRINEAISSGLLFGKLPAM